MLLMTNALPSVLGNRALEYCLCDLHIEYSSLRKPEAKLLHTKGEISTDVLQVLSQQLSHISSSSLFPLSNTVIPFLSHFLSLSDTQTQHQSFLPLHPIEKNPAAFH